MRKLTPSALFTCVGLLVCPAIGSGGPIGLLADPVRTITINFDSTAEVTESNGAKQAATKSSLTPAQRAAVVAKVQQEYDAVGAGVVKVSEGVGGDTEMIVSGGRAPDVGTKYGNAGKPGMPGVAYEGEFLNRGFADSGLVNAVAETVAHEAGHKLGLSHNVDSPVSKMTTGGSVDDSVRAADNREFNDHDIERLQKNLFHVDLEQRDSFSASDLGLFIGELVALPSNIPDDPYLDVFVTFLGPVGAEVGYISSSGEFVFQGDTTDILFPGFLTFIYSAGANLGVRFNNDVSSLENGRGTYSLFDTNPDNPSVFLSAILSFDTVAGPATLNLNAAVQRTTGGFTAPLDVVPEPSTAQLLLTGLLVFSVCGWRSVRNRRFSGCG